MVHVLGCPVTVTLRLAYCSAMAVLLTLPDSAQAFIPAGHPLRQIVATMPPNVAADVVLRDHVLPDQLTAGREVADVTVGPSTGPAPPSSSASSRAPK
jgi:hypothetical protein